jgi:hypothetical protein
MSEVVEIIKTSFDGLENKSERAIRDESLGLFTDDGKLTAQGNAAEFISKLPEIKMYIGWDGEVYPKFKLISRKVN